MDRVLRFHQYNLWKNTYSGVPLVGDQRRSWRVEWLKKLLLNSCVGKSGTLSAASVELVLCRWSETQAAATLGEHQRRQEIYFRIIGEHLCISQDLTLLTTDFKSKQFRVLFLIVFSCPMPSINTRGVGKKNIIWQFLTCCIYHFLSDYVKVIT